MRYSRLGAGLALGLLLLTAAYTAVGHFTNPVCPEDDAFITYRYAENLTAGKGMVYNPGERVFGASSPLYVVWLALLKKEIPRPLPWLAVRLNVIFYLLSAAGLLLLLERLVGGAGAARVRIPGTGWSISGTAAALTAAFMVADYQLKVSTGGMEAWLFAGLMLWSLWALAADRPMLSSLLAGLSVLVRPEGVLLGAVVLAGGYEPRAGGVRPWLRRLAVLLVPGLLWVGFAIPYYGTPVYHSIIAKSRPLYPMPFADALKRMYETAKPDILDGLVPAGTVRTVSAAVLCVVLAGLAVWGLARRTPREPDVTAEPLSTLGARFPAGPSLVLFGLFLSFYLVTNPLMFAWYYPPVLALWYLFLVTGIVRLVRNPGRLMGRRLILAGFVLVLALLTLRPPLTRLVTGRPLTDVGITTDPVRMRIEGYRLAAEWLTANVAPGVTVMGPEIGSLGYYYPGPIIDACALVSPAVVRFLPVPAAQRWGPGAGAISIEMVRSLTPDVVVTLGFFANQSIYRSNWFHDNYAGVKRFDLPLETWGSKTVDIFIRRDRLPE